MSDTLLPVGSFVGGGRVCVCACASTCENVCAHTMCICVEAKGLCLVFSSIASPNFSPEPGAD